MAALGGAGAGGGGGGAFLQNPTLLEQLLEEINFQRTKEMRQLLKDDSGFVVLQGTTYWTDLFVRHFLFQEEQSIDCDDLLFFVRKRHIKGSSRYLPKYETDVEVFRKDSKKLPIGDPDIDWEETVYLNLIVHQFDYTLTLAICTRTSPKELQVLKRHSQKVYASPSRRKMDTKGEGEEMTYPHICFMVDNFDEVFCDIVVRDGEMVCVELVARGRGGAAQAVIFLGSIRYDALSRVYDSRQSSLSTKVAQRMSFGLWSSRGAARCEFVRMKGPAGKGHAEMAVSKPKGSGVETPTSEPGLCALDMWDSDWDEDPEDFYVYRHQRRLSDPSANINNYCRSGWKTKAESSKDKSRSENEGLDSLMNGIAEVEAGDLRDVERRRSGPASSGRGGRCAGARCNSTASEKSRHRWRCCAAPTTADMSEVYTREHSTQDDTTTPACLHIVTPKRKGIKSSPGPPPLKPIHIRTPNKNKKEKPQEYEVADDAVSLDEEELARDRNMERLKDTGVHIDVRGKEELPCFREYHICDTLSRQVSIDPRGKTENEQNCPNKVTDTNMDNNCAKNTGSPKKVSNGPKKACNSKTDSTKKGNSTPKKAKNIPQISDTSPKKSKNSPKKTSNSSQIPDNSPKKTNSQQIPDNSPKRVASEVNGNDGDDEDDDIAKGAGGARAYCTLPRKYRGVSSALYRNAKIPPRRTTPDGTDIYYWCDMPKRKHTELDDGAYNPLWAMRGFTQTFHLWKEGKRQQSAPLNAFLTYVTLPWWSIAKDILDHREEPILTF